MDFERSPSNVKGVIVGIVVVATVIIVGSAAVYALWLGVIADQVEKFFRYIL